MRTYDVVIIGAGAAGLFAAAQATKRGHNVAIIDMGDAPARKVAASGGGRCNFTNMVATPERYFGNNKNFVRGALARFSPTDMLNWMKQHKLNFIEKAPGQYFCTRGAVAVVRALISDAHNADIFTGTTVIDADKTDKGFIIKTNRDNFICNKLIIATGGTSFGTLGVSDIGHKIAKKFGHKIVSVRPALCAIATHAF